MTDLPTHRQDLKPPHLVAVYSKKGLDEKVVYAVKQDFYNVKHYRGGRST